MNAFIPRLHSLRAELFISQVYGYQSLAFLLLKETSLLDRSKRYPYVDQTYNKGVWTRGCWSSGVSLDEYFINAKQINFLCSMLKTQ